MLSIPRKSRKWTFNSKAFATFSKCSRVAWKCQFQYCGGENTCKYFFKCINIITYGYVRTDAKYRLIDCVFWEKGAIKVCAYIQYFFRLLLYSNCMDDNNNKYRKKSVQGIISFHEYIIIMNIGQSILITERVSLFF